MHLDREELAWAAGFFDGEGHIGCTNNRNKKLNRVYRHLHIQIVQTNREVLERLQNALPFGALYGPYRENRLNHKSYWQWHVDSYEAVQQVVCALWPRLSRPKKEQAKAALFTYREYLTQPRLKPGPKQKGEPAK